MMNLKVIQINQTTNEIIKCIDVVEYAPHYRDQTKAMALSTKISNIASINSKFDELSISMPKMLESLNLEISDLSNAITTLTEQKTKETEQLKIDSIDVLLIKIGSDLTTLNTRKSTLTIEIATLPQNKLDLIAAQETEYAAICQAADTKYEAERFKPSVDQRIVSDIEFAKIGNERHLKLWDEATQTIIDKPDAVVLRITEENAKRIAAIKLKAGEIINARYPLMTGKQANMQSRAIELVLTQQSRTLTVEENTELQGLQTAWDWIKSVRAASNRAEIDGTLLNDIVWPQ